MGNCSSCFKVPPSPAPASSANNHSSTILEHKEENMELRGMFPTNTTQNHHHHNSQTNIESHVNGNNKNRSQSMYNNGQIVPDSNESAVEIKLRSSHGFYSRLPSLGRSGGSSNSQTLNSMTDNSSKHHKDPSESKINSLFEHYKDKNEDFILADGIERLCDDLQLSPDDFKVLVLAWKLNASQMCQFSRTEFTNGLKSMRVDSIRGIQQKLPEIVQEISNNAELFKDLYRFTFRFGLDVSSGQRILPADMAIVLWRLVFTTREPALLDRWLNFLESHHVRGIPKDTWNMFLNFAESIGDDLGAYDDAEAWPSLFDDFVEYENDQMNQNVTNVVKDST